MLKKLWSGPSHDGAAVGGVIPRHERGKAGRRALAAIAITTVVLSNLGLGVLGAPAAQAQSLSAGGTVSSDISKTFPTIFAGEDLDPTTRWTGKFEVWNQTTQQYQWLNGSFTKTAVGPTIPESYNSPEFTGPLIGEAGPIIEIGSQKCVQATSQPIAGVDYSSKVILATCDGRPSQTWVSSAAVSTAKGKLLSIESLDPATPGRLSLPASLVTNTVGLFLYTGPSIVGVLDPVEQTADLVFSSPTDNEVVAAPGTLTVSGTGRPGATVAVLDENGVPVGTPVVVGGDTKWSFPAKAFAAGPHTLTGAMAGKSASVSFSVGNRVVNPAMSTIVASPTSVTADGSSESTVTVVLKDSSGTPVGNNDASAEITTDLGTLSDQSTDGQGAFTAKLTSTQTGTATLGFTLGGTAAPATATVEFTPGDLVVDANNGTNFEVSAGDNVVSGEPHTITVKTTDANGNAVALSDPATQITASYAPTVTPAGSITISPFAATATPGTYTATVASQVSGKRTIAVSIDSQVVTPVQIDGKNQNIASFIAGPVDLTRLDSGFTVTDTEVLVVTGVHKAVVTLRDSFGNPIELSDTELAELKWAASPTTGVTLSAFTRVADAPGSYEANIKSTVAGSKTISVKLNGQDVAARGNAIAKFSADAPATSQSGTNFEVSTNRAVAGVDAHTITIRVVDASNNPVTTLTRSGLALQADPNTDVTFGEDLVQSSTEPGTYTVTVSSTRAGDKAISVLLGGNAVNPAQVDGVNKNTTATFVAGEAVTTDTTKSNFTVTSTPVVVGGTHTVSVRLADEFGNPVSGAVVSLGSPIVGGPLGLGQVSSFSEDPLVKGFYTATVRSTLVGTNTVAVTLGGATVGMLDGGNNKAEFIAGAPSAATSSISVDTDTVQANGTSFATATVVLKDSYGNLITSIPGDAAVTISSSVGNVTATGLDPMSNVFVARVSSASAGTATVSYTLNSAAGSNTTSVEFVSVSAPNVNYANGFSVSGSGVKGQKILVRDSDGTVIGSVTISEDDGSFLVPISGVSTGDVLKVVAVDGNGFESAPVSVTVDADAPGEPVVDPSNGDKISGETKPGSTVVVKDEDGNVLCSTTADAEDGKFSCVPSPKPEDGDKIYVEVKDPSGNDSPTGSVVIDQIAPDAPVVDPSNGSKVSGTAEPGSKVVVKGEGDVVLCEVTADEIDGSFSCVPAPKPADGDTIRVTATDPSGNESEPTTVVIDQIAPDAPVVDPSNGSKVSGTAEPGSKVVVKGEGDVVLCEVTADETDGSFSCVPAPKPADGDTIRVTATDPSGNESEPTTVVIDQQGPGEPVVDPSNGDKISGETKPGSTVVVKDEDGNVLCSTTADAEDGKFSCVPSPKPEDGDKIYVEVKDPSGNDSPTGSVVIDQIAPDAPVVDPSNGSKVSGTAEPGSKVVVKGEGDVVLCEVTADEIDGSFSCVPAPKPADGDTIRVTATDPAGNESEPTSVVIDQQGPGEPVVDPSNGDKISGETKPGSTVVVKDEDGNVLCSTTADAEDGKFSCVPSPKPEDGDKIYVEVKDPSGNDSPTGSVVIDQIAPDAPVVDPSNGSKVSGTAEAGSTVTVKDAGDTVLCVTTAKPDGSFSCVPNPRPEDGVVVAVTATDPSGNESEPTTIVIDRIAPNAPVVNPSNGSQISGTGEAGAKVTVVGPGGTELCTTTVNSQGQFMCVPNPRPAHGDEILVTLTDPAGNVSEPGSVIINTVPPTAPIVDLSNGKSVTGGVIEDGNSVTLIDGQGNKIPGVTVVDPAGRFTFTPTVPLTEADTAFVVVSDPAGNTTQVPVRIKTSKPAKPVVDPGNGDTVTGCAEPGSIVNVYDESGRVIGSAVAGDDCKFTVVLTPEQEEGATITVDATDGAGNGSESVRVRVGLISIVLATPEVQPGQTQTAYGYGFQPGEVVTGVLRSTLVDLGSQVADAKGTVTFTFTVANDIEAGEHSVTLSGDFSGSVRASFQVVMLASDVAPSLSSTGGELMLPLAGALALLLTGAGLVVARRRQQDPVS